MIVAAKTAQTNSAGPDQTATSEESDQDLSCLLFRQAFCEFHPQTNILFENRKRKVFETFLRKFTIDVIAYLIINWNI